jgi:replicative superfamily II helicase
MKAVDYVYGNYPFEEFNPVQNEVFPYIESDSNVVIASPTSSGKTIAGELLAGKALSEEKRIVYLSPLKALVEEKVQDWSEDSHPWSQYSTIAMTGDYVMSEEREEELSQASIIIATYEMMAVRCRRAKLEKTGWIEEVGVLLVDEAHFIASDGRGDHLENALVAFTMRNPSARIVFMSATLRNFGDFVEWLTILNSKQTHCVYNNYRPCKLSIHYCEYTKPLGGYTAYREEENRKLATTLQVINKYPDNQWLIFVHAKTTGGSLFRALRSEFPHTTISYHNADLERKKRSEVENNFREGKIRYLVATSTLAYGLNLPARRVAIVGTKRGINEVDPMDVIQECGRAGRPKYDKEGDAYVILSNKDASKWKVYLTQGVDVWSKLATKPSFHLVGEVAEGRVSNERTANEWASRTLARSQGSWHDVTGQITLQDLNDIGAVVKSPNSDWVHNSSSDDRGGDGDYFRITPLGRIAAYMYFDPHLVHAWKRNLGTLLDRGTSEDAAIAWAIGNMGGREGYLPKQMRGLSSDYLSALRQHKLTMMNDASLAVSTTLFFMMQGYEDRGGTMNSHRYTLLSDIDRITTCMNQIETRIFSRKQPKTGTGPLHFWRVVANRVRYGIERTQAELCLLPGVGKIHSQKLKDAGVTMGNIQQRKTIVGKILPAKTLKNVLAYLNP